MFKNLFTNEKVKNVTIAVVSISSAVIVTAITLQIAQARADYMVNQIIKVVAAANKD